MLRSKTSGSLSEELVGDSPSMKRLREKVAAVAACDVNLLLHGESGTGKELVSRMVHKMSSRKGARFIGVNCAAIHETLLESELFGHEAGAFTDARCARPGLLRAADGGTILLDEVGDMSEALQSKLLRVLEERAVVPVGGTKPIPIDVRVISATHQNLRQAVREGRFRQDLYFRLKVVRLSIPPLRDRRSDIPLLAGHMLRRIAELLEVPPKGLSAAATDVLVRYDWPGNVRELGNAIQHAYVFCRNETIGPQDLPPELLDIAVKSSPTFPTLQEAVGRHVEKALELSGGVCTRAAQILAVDRKTLRRMRQRYNLP